MDRPNTLVVYYSDTGNTRHVAEETAKLLDAVLEPIRPCGLKSGPWGYLLRAWAALRGQPAEIEDSRNDPRAFGLVVICSPIWAGHLSTPVRGYLSRHAESLRHVALALTSSAEVKSKAQRDLKAICGRDPEALVQTTDADRKSGEEAAKIAEFVDRAKAAVSESAVDASRRVS